MEPQDNRKLALGKAVAAHEQAGAALNDLLQDGQDPRLAAMLERVRQNEQELRALAAVSLPEDHV